MSSLKIVPISIVIDSTFYIVKELSNKFDTKFGGFVLELLLFKTQLTV
jgi:hypothetical protein